MTTLAGAGRQHVYASNGSGRDSYVAINNGGLRVSHTNNNQRVGLGSFVKQSMPRKASRDVMP